MNRRDFLKVAGSTLAVGTVAVTLPRVSQALSLALPERTFRLEQGLFKGDNAGQVFLSPDDGKTWQRLVSVGEDFQVQEIYSAGAEIMARIGVGPYSFLLRTIDGRTWRTA